MVMMSACTRRLDTDADNKNSVRNEDNNRNKMNWFEADDLEFLCYLQKYAHHKPNANLTPEQLQDRLKEIESKIIDQDRLLSLPFDTTVYDSHTTRFNPAVQTSHASVDADENKINNRLQEEGERWFYYILNGAKISGFSVSISQAISTTNRNDKNDELNEMPKAFLATEDGRWHLQALMEVLEISKEKGIKLTMSTFKEFASHVVTDIDLGDEVANDDWQESLRSLLGTFNFFQRVVCHHKQQFLARLRIITECIRLELEYSSENEGKNDESASRDQRTFAEVGEVHHHEKKQYGQSNDQKQEKHTDPDVNISAICCQFLNSIDSKVTLNGKRRGLFLLLLRLATGPLPRSIACGNSERLLPLSVSKLRGAGDSVNFHHSPEPDDLTLLEIRNEAIEALILLLYDRIDGGVQRLDYYQVLDGGSGTENSYLEFGMSPKSYFSRSSNSIRKETYFLIGRGRTVSRGLSHVASRQEGIPYTIEEMRRRLNGLWALLCAECMGLWRTVSDGKGEDGDWLRAHPFFSGFNFTEKIDSSSNLECTSSRNRTPLNAGKLSMMLPSQESGDGLGCSVNSHASKVELEALSQRLRSLGETLRDRRQIAYNNIISHRSREIDDMKEDLSTSELCTLADDNDDELWGVEASEGVAILSYGLLLRLAHLSDKTNNVFLAAIGELGVEYAQIANDECGAFAFLHRVLKVVVKDPLNKREELIRRLDKSRCSVVKEISGRREIEILINNDSRSLIDSELIASLTQENIDSKLSVDLASDASSVVYASIGREVLSATIRVFRDELLLLQSPSSFRNICMLVDLASLVYRNSAPLCHQFWTDWEVFCDKSDSMQDDVYTFDESMCLLLDTAYSLAVSTLVQVSHGGCQHEINKSLYVSSSFLHLIASLCASPLAAQNILTSNFLPEGLVSKVVSTCSALAPSLSLMYERKKRVTPEDRRIILYLTVAMQSISTLVSLGEEVGRAWIQQLMGVGEAPKILCEIAHLVMPRKHYILEQELAELATCTLNLLGDLLMEADVSLQIETSKCFLSSNAFGDTEMSGITPFIMGGIQNEATLSALSILSHLTIQMTQNSFDLKRPSSEEISFYIKNLSNAVVSGLEILTTLSSGGEITAYFTHTAVAVCHFITTSTLMILVGIKPIIYLHQDANVRDAALKARNDVISKLSTSTAVGQVVAFLASLPVSSMLTNNASSLRELTHIMKTAVLYRESSTRNSKYGTMEKFVTPKRASQKTFQRAPETTLQMLHDDGEYNMGALKEFTLLSTHAVSEVALCLIYVWGDHYENILDSFHENSKESFLLQSPSNLLLSKAYIPPFQNDFSELNIANLNLISRLINFDDGFLGGSTSTSAFLSVKVIKMCLYHNSLALEEGRVGLNLFRVALENGCLLSKLLLRALTKLAHDSNDYFDGMENLVVLANIILETVTICVASEPDLAKCILMNEGGDGEWTVIDTLVNSLESTTSFIHAMNRNQLVDTRVLKLRCMMACGCLGVISELWKNCRFMCSPNLSDSHACVSVIIHLFEDVNSTSIINAVMDLTRSSLLRVVSLEKRNSMQGDAIDTELIQEKGIIFDMLSQLLAVLAIETVVRVQSHPREGVKFLGSLIDQDHLECWLFLLSLNRASSLAASSWAGMSSVSIVKSTSSDWNRQAFLRAFSSEKATCSTTWCSSVLATRFVTASLKPSPDFDDVNSFMQCNSLNILALAEMKFVKSWAHFIEVLTVNTLATRSANEVYALTTSLIDGILDALSTISLSMIASYSQEVLSHETLPMEDLHPIKDLCSLLMKLLFLRSKSSSMDNISEPKKLLQMLRLLYESSNRLLIIMHLDHNVACIVQREVFTCAILLISEYQSLLEHHCTRQEIMKYNELRLGWVDITLTTMLSLKYISSEDEKTMFDDSYQMLFSFEYNFGSGREQETNQLQTQEKAAFQLLCVCLSCLSTLVPSFEINKWDDEIKIYLERAYGTDFTTCLKQRKALNSILYHFNAASAIASLTLGSAKHSLVIVHQNAVDVIQKITTLIYRMTSSSSSTVDLFFLMMEARCFQSLIDNPLLKLSCKTWTASCYKKLHEQDHYNTFERGYITPPSELCAKNNKIEYRKHSLQNDKVHSIWCTVISIFSTLVQSTRQLSHFYAGVDDYIFQKLQPSTNIVFDFVCTYENAIFTCFSLMQNQLREIDNSQRKNIRTKPSLFASTISSSPFSFTPNLLNEATEISLLFSELCKGDIKNKFESACINIYKKMIVSILDVTKILSSFLGSIGNARELFLALSESSFLSFDQPSSMYDAHSLLVDGIPNARHESICNSHYASSCCVIATAEDFVKSHASSMGKIKPLQTDQCYSNLEQTFQIHVNNEFICEMEELSGHCILYALSILSNTHPASGAFVSFSAEESSQLNLAAVINPGALVAFVSQDSDRSLTNSNLNLSRQIIQYALAKGCDSSAKTIFVEASDSESVCGVQQHIPWSWIVGIEDITKHQCCLLHQPAPKSIAEADPQGPTSIGHLILALRWCRHVSKSSNLINLAGCIANHAAILLSTEIVLYDGMNEKQALNDEQKLNTQLLELFKNSEGFMNEYISSTVKRQLQKRLEGATSEHELQQKIWEYQNSDNDSASFWGGNLRKDGHRSPFRAFTRLVSTESMMQ